MKFTLLSLLLWMSYEVHAQQKNKDSLLYLLSTAAEDTAKVHLLADLAEVYRVQSNLDSALLTYGKGLALSRQIGYLHGEVNFESALGFYSWQLGDFSSGIKSGYRLMEIAKSTNDTILRTAAAGLLQNNYRDLGDFDEAIKINMEILPFIFSPTGNKCNECNVFIALIGSNYYGKANYDSALHYLNQSLTYPHDYYYGWILLMIGRTWDKLNNDSMAKDYLRQSIIELTKNGNSKDLAGAYTVLANSFVRKGQTDSAVYYGKLALNIAKDNSFQKELLEAYLSLSTANEKINKDDAIKYYKLASGLKDHIYNQDKQIQISSFKYNDIIQKNELQAAKDSYNNRMKTNAMLGSIFTLLTIAFFLSMNNRQKQKARIKIESAYHQLQSTQSQLIQTEKMASLGELTAGIAHEIQNPLNFVNNFSEINMELSEEIMEAAKSNDRDEIIRLAADIKFNHDKINEHGKRADAIVKGMLQHARSSSGVKEPADFNKLADEYFRLAYHGLRAKDKSFNVKLHTDFDPAIGKIPIVSQDIGRVLLNLYNNAFYAVNEKMKSAPNGYEPQVSVITRLVVASENSPIRQSPPFGGRGANSLIIAVKDNGNGIPQKILDKIFQPFFTTKPTGQGTGLGLSLSYDIVKAHGGELRVQTKEGEGSEFEIQLPA